MPIETVNISFKSTQNEQQYCTKITSTEVRRKSYREFKFDLKIGFREEGLIYIIPPFKGPILLGISEVKKP